MSYYTEFSQYKGGDTMIKENTIRNNESNIKEFELLKHFYLRKKNLISLEEFEECLKEHKDTRLDRLLNAGVLKSINTKLEITHMNLLDNTVEGVMCKEDYVSSVQYHPESAPGPQDSAYLFDRFIRMMEEEGHHA